MRQCTQARKREEKAPPTQTYFEIVSLQEFLHGAVTEMRAQNGIYLTFRLYQ